MNKNLDELLLYESSVPVIVQGGENLLCSLRGLLLGVPLEQEAPLQLLHKKEGRDVERSAV
jgi:hypothetical protein